jgi:hypothetical protein
VINTTFAIFTNLRFFVEFYLLICSHFLAIEFNSNYQSLAFAKTCIFGLAKGLNYPFCLFAKFLTSQFRWVKLLQIDVGIHFKCNFEFWISENSLVLVARHSQ